jgi:5-methylcytosine-specific restriction protein A
MKRLTGFSPLVRYQIEERSNTFCERCGGLAMNGQAHHRRPRGMGSSRNPETNQAGNALWLCTTWDTRAGGDGCHERTEANRAEALQYGWLVSQHRTPVDVPVLRRGIWVLLDNQGGYTTIPEPAGGKVA